MPKRWQTGDTIALRNIWGERVLTAFPAILVQDQGSRRMFHVRSGSIIYRAVDHSGRPIRIPTGTWRLEARPWTDVDVLSFAWPHVGYSVEMFWGDHDHAFRGWYVNLQTPLASTSVGFDYVDHILDLVVSPHRLWRWKDEDEFGEAQRLGLISTKEATRIRQLGEEAIRRVEAREEPFDGAWIGWRPDPSWPMPELPDGWDTVPCG